MAAVYLLHSNIYAHIAKFCVSIYIASSMKFQAMHNITYANLLVYFRVTNITMDEVDQPLVSDVIEVSVYSKYAAALVKALHKMVLSIY